METQGFPKNTLKKVGGSITCITFAFGVHPKLLAALVNAQQKASGESSCEQSKSLWMGAKSS